MSKIPTDQLREGMIFSKPVYIDGDNLLVPPRVPLRRKDIERLQRWDVAAVETDGQLMTSEDVRRARESETFGRDPGNDLQDFYTGSLEQLGTIFRRIAAKSTVDQDEVDAIGGAILQRVIERKNDCIQLVFSNVKTDHQLALRAVDTTIVALVMGLAVKLNSHRLMQLASGTLMHDVGMLEIDETILGKQGKLDEQELARVRMHTEQGYQFLSKAMRYPEDIAVMALQHHERWDGSGYPRGIEGQRIAQSAHIIAIADAYGAMVHDRPYRTSMIGYAAMKSLLGDNGRHFDPRILKAFLGSMGIFPVGSIVQLNDGGVAKVISANGDAPLRPRLEVLIDARGVRLKEPRKIDLTQRSEVFIAKAVDPREYVGD